MGTIDSAKTQIVVFQMDDIVKAESIFQIKDWNIVHQFCYLRTKPDCLINAGPGQSQGQSVDPFQMRVFFKESANPETQSSYYTFLSLCVQRIGNASPRCFNVNVQPLTDSLSPCGIAKDYLIEFREFESNQIRILEPEFLRIATHILGDDSQVKFAPQPDSLQWRITVTAIGFKSSSVGGHVPPLPEVTCTPAPAPAPAPAPTSARLTAVDSTGTERRLRSSRFLRSSN